MKTEHQQVEWKETWRDEYLKWISGFANAEGGVLVIGMDDEGKIVGVPDARKLLVDLPNKVRDVLGILSLKTGSSGRDRAPSPPARPGRCSPCAGPSPCHKPTRARSAGA